MTRRFPDFLIIGAMRAGTTSLYRYLGAHPDIHMSPTKEIHFFDREFSQGVDWYLEHFTHAAKDQLCGEATPSYVSNAQAMTRLASLIPDSKLIVSLRNPVDRAWSHYWMRYERGLESRSFQEAIQQEKRLIMDQGPDTPRLFYLGHGMYAHHLRRVLDLYPREQLHITFVEHMQEAPKRQYEELCNFLGVRPEVIPTVVGNPINPYVSFRSRQLRRFAKRLPRQVDRLIGRINTKMPGSYAELEATSRASLADFFAASNSELEELIGKPVSWSHG